MPLKRTILAVSMLAVGASIARGNGDHAAVNYVLASNGGLSCGLVVDQAALRNALIRDGLDRRIVSMEASGIVAQGRADPTLRKQYYIWNNTLGSLRITYADCQSIYNHFGPDGDIYRGVLAKPPRPYSPFDLK